MCILLLYVCPMGCSMDDTLYAPHRGDMLSPPGISLDTEARVITAVTIYGIHYTRIRKARGYLLSNHSLKHETVKRLIRLSGWALRHPYPQCVRLPEGI